MIQTSTAPAAPPRRILIVRLSALGDAVHTLPLAAALRDLYPDCFLGWLSERPAEPLIAGNPLLDWTHALPKGWLKSPRLVLDARRRLRAQNFDTAFDVQSLSKSAIAAWLSGAKTRIGFTRGEGREIAPLLDTVLVQPTARHAVDMTLELLSGLGATAPGPARFILPRCPAGDRAKLDALLQERERDLAGGFVLMGPWGSFGSKLWPLRRFLELAGRIRDASGIPSLMLGHGDRERGIVLELTRENPDALIPAPDVGLLGVAELARNAIMFVGCDSFPMHAAAAVGCATLGLFGVTDPARLGPYGPTGRAVYERLTLVRSTRERGRLPPDNMLALTTDKVFQACLETLKPALAMRRRGEGIAAGTGSGAMERPVFSGIHNS